MTSIGLLIHVPVVGEQTVQHDPFLHCKVQIRDTPHDTCSYHTQQHLRGLCVCVWERQIDREREELNASVDIPADEHMLSDNIAGLVLLTNN